MTEAQITDKVLEELDDQNKFNFVHHDLEAQVARFRLSSESDEIAGNAINVLNILYVVFAVNEDYIDLKHINIIRFYSKFSNSKNILKSRKKGQRLSYSKIFNVYKLLQTENLDESDKKLM